MYDLYQHGDRVRFIAREGEVLDLGVICAQSDLNRIGIDSLSWIESKMTIKPVYDRSTDIHEVRELIEEAIDRADGEYLEESKKAVYDFCGLSL